MDYEDQDHSFSSLVETQTLDDILSPIADKVSTLLHLLKVREGVPLPDLFTPASKLDVAVKEMVEIAKNVIIQSPSEELQLNMTVACGQLLSSAQELVEAARQLGRRPTPEAQTWLGSAAHGVFEGTLKVLLVWDDGEVDKIVSVCYDVLDKLALVQGAKSMRSLAVCFRGFSETVTSLFHLVENRRKVLIVPQKKHNIQVAWKDFQSTIPKLSLTLQNFVKNHDSIEVKRARDLEVEKTSNAIYNVIRAIEKFPTLDENVGGENDKIMQQKGGSDDSDEGEAEQEVHNDQNDVKDDVESLPTSGIPKNMSGSILKVQGYLQSSSPYFIDPKFDKHIDAIIHNSMAVALMSNNAYKQAITQLCNEVMSLRAKLHKCLGRIRSNPESEEAKVSFDETAELICEKLRELDRWVALAVVNEVTETFGVPDDPIDHLVEAAIAPSRTPRAKHPAGAANSVSPAPVDSDKGLSHHVEVFRRHSKRLSQVAQAAAQSTADAGRVERIQSLASELERLTALVVQAALDVKNDPANRECKERLHSLRKEWARAVRELTAALDEVINPEEFIALSIDNISHDLAKCQDAMETGDRLELASRVQMIAAKAERVAEVVMTEVEEQPCSEEYKANLVGKVTKLKKSVTAMKSHANRYLDDPSSQESYDAFVGTVRDILDIIKQIQSTLQEVVVEETFSSTSLDEYESTPTPPTPRAKATNAPAKARAAQASSQQGVGGVPLRTRTLPKPHHIGATGTLKPVPAPRGQPAHPSKGSGLQTVPLRAVAKVTGHASGHASGRTSQAAGHTSQAAGHTSQAAGRVHTARGNIDGTTHAPGHAPRATDRTKHATDDTTHVTDHMSHVTDYTPHGTDHTPHVTDYTPHGTDHTPHVTDHMTHVTDHTPHVTDHMTHVADHTTQTPPPVAKKIVPMKAAADHTPSDAKDAATLGMQSYSSPLQGLVSAAKAGASTQIPDCATILSERAKRLVEMARTVASSATSTPELSRALEMKAREVVRLTPSLIRHAEKVARDPRAMKELEELEADISQWAGHVRYLIDATQKANLPWSRTAEKLVTAAKTGEGLQTQIKHVSTQTEKMIEIALASVKAAEREEAIGCTSDSSMLTQDPQVQAEMEHVQSTMEEIRQLTPELIKAAEDAAQSGSVEPLRLVAYEWATKAKALMKRVDNLSLGMSGPADALIISAASQDPALLEDHARNMKGLASTLQTVAMDSVAGCPDASQVEEIQVTAKNIEKVSSQLAECANELMTMEEESPEVRQATEEKKELLSRDWATQVHLLTAHIDELTAHVTTPLDTLVSIALEASKTDLAKDHLMSRFKSKAGRLKRQLEQLRQTFDRTVKGVAERQRAVDNADRAITFLTKLSPHVVRAARALSNDPASPLLDHYHHLRRQWASKAHYLGANLKMIAGVDTHPVLEAFDQLIHGTLSPLNTSGEAEDSPQSPMTKSYSSENIFDEMSSSNLRSSTITPSAPHTGPLKKRSLGDYSSPGTGEVVLKLPHRLPKDALPETSGEGASNSILAAARSLRDTTDRYEDEGNVIIAVAKELPQLTAQLAAFARGTATQESRKDMTDLASAIVANCQKMAEFAKLVAQQCTDQITKDNLEACAEKIPTLSTQLKILASVKASAPDDLSAGVMLVKNIQNLMQAVTNTIHAAETASVKGLQHVPDSKATAYALNWKRKLYSQRTMEAIVAPLGTRGLRKLSREYRSSTRSLMSDEPPRTYESH